MLPPPGALPAERPSVALFWHGRRSGATGCPVAPGARSISSTPVFLERLAPAQWQRASQHNPLGRMTYDNWPALVAAHDDKHREQFQRALAGRV